MRVYLDVDDVVLEWHKGYAKRFNCDVPRRWRSSKKMTERLNILSKEKDFWLNLDVKNRPDFIPAGYVSARGIPKAWTVESLKINDIPGRSLIRQVGWGESKIDILKELKCDIFIDDKYATFKECHKNGIFCLLMDAPHNQHIQTPFRIYTLNIDNILYMWRKLRHQLK